jgi:hypothetical protein
LAVTIAVLLPSAACSKSDKPQHDPVASQKAAVFAATGSMSTGRVNHTATLLTNGTVLVTGGCTSDPIFNNASQLSTAEVFDPATGSFSATTGTMAVTRCNHAAARLNDSPGTVLVAGGGISGSSDSWAIAG